MSLPRPRATQARLRVVALVAACIVATPGFGERTKPRQTPSTGSPQQRVANPPDPRDPRTAQAEESAERDRLTARIADLKKQIAAGERSRSGAAAALQRAERTLAEVNRRLDELARRQREGEERVAGLDRQRAGTDSLIARQQAVFGRTATMLYANGARDALHDWLGGGEPGDGALDGAYLQIVAKSLATDLDGLRGRARELQSQRQQADADTRALLAQAEVQRSAREALAADQATQRRSLAQISAQLAQQRATAAALAADEQRLTRVVERLQRTIERQAAEERARRDAARRRAGQSARKDQGTKARDEPPPTVVDRVPDETNGDGAFAQLRGQLRLPARGTIVGRFGAPRGIGGATWKGVFVQTATGAEVHAVAAGKVVFADDLRGFGNLVIVDHGDQYLSIYGNNETLLKRSGDRVKPGEVISRAGNSSGDDRTGLYFELRFQGRPFDPLGWTGAR